MPAVVTYGKSAYPKQSAKLLEMRAADEVAGVNTMHGAHLVTGLATRAFSVIYGRKIIYYCYCALGAFLGAETAGYTAAFANTLYANTLIVIVTFYDYALGIVYKMYDTVRAGLNAKAAADTASGIYLGDVFLGIYAYCVARADIDTVAVAEAGKGAKSVARVAHICRKAGRGAVIFILAL